MRPGIGHRNHLLYYGFAQSEATGVSSHTAVIIGFNRVLTPRQAFIVHLLSRMGFLPKQILWDRSQNGPTTFSMDGHIAAIRLGAPTESARLLWRMPRYLHAVRDALKVILGEEKDPVIVLTHPFQLFLTRYLPQARWVYDAAEYFAHNLAQYGGLFASLMEPALSGLESRGIKNMRAVLAVDSRNGWFAQQLGRGNPHVVVIPNFPLCTDDPTDQERLEAQAQLKGRETLVYVGGLLERKGIDVALRALQLIVRERPQVQLLLCGPLQGHEETLRNRIHELGLEAYTRLEGFLPYRRMLALISAASIGLVLYQRTPYHNRLGALNGRKLFTYMQAGLAVVAPCFGEMGRAVEEARCGLLVETDDPNEVSSAVVGLLGDPVRLAEFRSCARVAFETRFNGERVAETLAPWLMERLRPET